MPKILMLTLILALLPACTPVTVEDYREAVPRLEAEQFFSGYLTAHGVVKDRGGKVIRTFNADIDASWSDGVGTLVEDFLFDDGEEQRRIWTLQPGQAGTYRATAPDVVGPGTMTVAGNSAFLDYILRIPYGDSTIDIHVDDRMYLVSPNVLINESAMKKFGVSVGSIGLVIIRHGDEFPGDPGSAFR